MMARSWLQIAVLAFAACNLLTGASASFVMLGDSFSDDGRGANPVVQSALSKDGVRYHSLHCFLHVLAAVYNSQLPSSANYSTHAYLIACSLWLDLSHQLRTTRVISPMAACGSRSSPLPLALS